MFLSRFTSSLAAGLFGWKSPTPGSMGSIQVEEVYNNEKKGTGGLFSTNDVNIALAQPTAPTGLREEVLLLSWLIVLARTREDSAIRFQWAYQDGANGGHNEPETRSLSMEEMVPNLQSTVNEVTATISRHIAEAAPSESGALSKPASLLLSTSSLSPTPAEAKDEGVLHLEVRLESGALNIHPAWRTDNMLPYTVSHHIRSLADIIEMCTLKPDTPIANCIRLCATDLDDIWGWNHLLPPSYDLCMHEVIANQTERFPDKDAIAAWDGNLTYSQIDQYSTSVALSLREMGVQLHDFIPVCFEKSKWTIVAVLAVMKAGATLVLMDPTLPLARLQNMGKQVDAKTMLASQKQQELALSILPDGKHFTVDAEAFTDFSPSQITERLPAVPASALMYIIFTSGSTGTPKGVKISHQAYTSSAFPRAKAVGYTEDSRVLDFASYAFDVSIDSMLLTLGNGGCLCIPSDEDRMNDINGVIRRMKVNYAGLTPSVARILEPDVIASMTGLGLGGEAASARDVTLWGQDTRIIIGYGPCECTIGCTVNSSAATGRDYISIGPGNGAAIWITDPNDHETLVPVGAIGELLVEGPIVGQGYLNDDEKTAAAFIHDPQWLVSGHKNYPGRRGRLYKTGDLGKYDPDGTGGIVFVGRKDTQVKLRGQRVELGEIESQLRARLPSDTTVIAEVIVSNGQPTLVAFIAAQSSKGPQEMGITSVELSDELRQTLSQADAEIATVLPRYMVPTAYIPVSHIPALISGKTDRKQLRQFGATVDLKRLDQDTTDTPDRELNDQELRLQQAWSETLKLPVESIRPDDHFFALGGDSVAAMRLVSVCRTHGLDLTVTNIFSHPTLLSMASVVEDCDSHAHVQTAPFSMISQGVESARLEASALCGSEQTAVEDIYPCTPTQESLFTFSLKSIEAYVAQRVACIPSHITLDAWKRAWEEVVAEHPILRSHLAQLQDPGLQQVVLKGDIHWRHSTGLARYLQEDLSERMNLGESLARYAIVDDEKDGKRYMVWTVHHVLYDGWSEPIILQKVSRALQDQASQTKSEAYMRDFVRFVRDTDESAMQEFWRHELKGAVGPQFPRLPSRDYFATPDSLIEHQVRLETSAGWPFTLATLIRGAWALVASQHTGSDDVVFGETLTGRDIALPGVEGIVGPLIATVPVRVRVSRSSSVESYLQTVQEAMLARVPYQHIGWQNIRKVSQDAQYACETGTGLVIQPDPEYVGSELGFSRGDVVREALHFNPYPVMLGFGVQKGGFRVCASFDSNLIEMAQMKRILAQLETACLQLTKGLETRIGDISCLPDTELDQVWQWNQTAPLSLDESSGTLRAQATVKLGSAYPPAVVPWICSPRNSSLLSPIGCVGELWLEGHCLSGETTESPSWLTAGSSTWPGRGGRVQSTGDLALWKDDGSIVFVGRKENVTAVQGHAVDIAELEAHMSRQLPSNIKAAAAISQPLSEGEQTADPELIILVEQLVSEGEELRLLSASYEIPSDSSSVPITISDTIPAALALGLKKLDKFIRDSLPSYMIPSTYVVVDKLPTTLGYSDHSLLNHLASQIPLTIRSQLREGFNQAWIKTSKDTNLTGPEGILRSAWANILKLTEEQIDVDDNFFRLGGDSVLAMKLVSSLRAQGHGLSVADIFQRMRLSDAAKVLKVDQKSATKLPPYTPFSTLGRLDIDSFLSAVVHPQLADPEWTVRDVLPVTDSQGLDVRATIQGPRTSIQYTMLYLDKSIDQGKLVRAWQSLVQTHEILRTVFIEHESSLFQVVLEQLDAPVVIRQADKEIEQYVNELCSADIESDFHLGSSFLKTFYIEGNDAVDCLVLGLSHSQYDGMSLPRLLRDLETLYTGEEVVDFEPFSSYIARVRDISLQNQAIDYWSNLLLDSSLSILEGPVGKPTERSVFQTKTVETFQPLQEITTANLLSAAWALVLARRLKTTDVTFGSVTSGRSIDLANVENVVGPCYQLTPIRVMFGSQWTAMDLLRLVQRQSGESAAHDFLGFDKISKECASWPSETRFFDSIVHHQDHEDFDTMPFAGGECRVDILNPHGDAAYPLKAVSFMRGGKLLVGVVGSENDAEFVTAVLDELAGAVQELATEPGRVITVE